MMFYCTTVSVFIALIINTESFRVFLKDDNDIEKETHSLAEASLHYLPEIEDINNQISRRANKVDKLSEGRYYENNIFKRKRLPVLPNENCQVGKIYRTKDNCNRCFCKEGSKPQCTRNKSKCLKKLSTLVNAVKSIEDIRTVMTKTEVDALEQLQDFAAQCVVGKEYKILCNVCACLNTGELLCDEKLCLNYNETLQVQAETYNQMFHSNCTKDNEKVVDDTIECNCSKVSPNLLSCIPKPGTKPPKDAIHVLDKNKDACQPGMAYNYFCNTCYCQDDSELRCGQHYCISYNDSKQIQKAVMSLF